jgi:hypothetical protein
VRRVLQATAQALSGSGVKQMLFFAGHSSGGWAELLTLGHSPAGR